MRILVTGGLGFIGFAVIRHLINDTDHQMMNLDKRPLSSVKKLTRKGDWFSF